MGQKQFELTKKKSIPTPIPKFIHFKYKIKTKHFIFFINIYRYNVVYKVSLLLNLT